MYYYLYGFFFLVGAVVIPLQQSTVEVPVQVVQACLDLFVEDGALPERIEVSSKKLTCIGPKTTTRPSGMYVYRWKN